MAQYRNDKKTGSSTNKTSGEAKFHLRFKISSFYHFQGVIAAGKRNKGSLLHKAAPLWHLFTPKFHLFHVGRKRPVGAAPSPEGTSARGQAPCHGSWFPETNTGKEKKREVGRAWLLHPSWALFRLGAVSGLLRERIPRAAWGLRSRARTSSLGPTSQQDPLGEGWSSFCQQGQGPASFRHLCAFYSHRGVTER